MVGEADDSPEGFTMDIEKNNAYGGNFYWYKELSGTTLEH